MIKPFKDIVDHLTATFRLLEEQVPPPVKVDCEEGFKIRYEEQDLRQALLLKFARYISGLQAIDLLLSEGFCQEVGVIQRTLDDIEEDVAFLSIGRCTGEWTERHELYLEHFWSEEPGVGMVSRDKIRAFVHRAGGSEDPSTGISAARTIFKGYSGFVHAGATAAIDMWGLEPPHFHLSGMKCDPLYGDHLQDAWNPFYRGLTTACFIAQAFGDEQIAEESIAYLKAFEGKFAAFIFPTK